MKLHQAELCTGTPLKPETSRAGEELGAPNHTHYFATLRETLPEGEREAEAQPDAHSVHGRMLSHEKLHDVTAQVRGFA